MKLFDKKPKKAASPKAEDSLVNPKVLEVNLVKVEISIEFNWSKHLLALFLTLAVAAIFVGEIYYGLNWWQQQEEEKTVALNTEYETVSKQIKNVNYNSKDFVSFKDKLDLTKKLADSHVYWSDFFDWLEAKTLNTVSYNGFSGDISGQYTMSAEANDFSDISWQVKNFKADPFVISARVDSGSVERKDENSNTAAKVSFPLIIQVKPAIFYRQAE